MRYMYFLISFFLYSLDIVQVTITPRLILSHLSGIRHYEKDAKKVREEKEKAKRLIKIPEQNEKEEKNSAVSKEKSKAEEERISKTKEDKKKKEFEQEEYYLKDRFENVIQALDLFKNDPLIYKPGATSSSMSLLMHWPKIWTNC